MKKENDYWNKCFLIIVFVLRIINNKQLNEAFYISNKDNDKKKFITSYRRK